ncbi:DUF6404 family protein [uncultured Tateyamaria sp.]|uniref:DUF6404 family protein n=1 Tax=uncultured Tateyamaria sp. TaxID=455651 RepID=UPI002635E9E3|nr:DUF6404 family protein [uncultured Tateyamaria sp.]
MSEYQRRFEAAEIELDEAGVWPSNAVPLYFRFLRMLGLKPVLPHYKPFWRSFLGNSAFFITLIAVISIVPDGIPEGRSTAEFGLRTVLIGSALGATMSVYYAITRRKNALSRWADL